MVVDFVRRAVELPEGTLPAYRAERTAKHHRGLVRKQAGVTYDQAKAELEEVRLAEQEIKARMPERSLMGIVARTAYWVGVVAPFRPAVRQRARAHRPLGPLRDRHVRQGHRHGSVRGRPAHPRRERARTVVRRQQALLDRSAERGGRRPGERAGPPGPLAGVGRRNRGGGGRHPQWIGFGNRGVIADNDPIEQEKAMRFNALLTNAVIFRNVLDIAEIVRQLLEEGWEIDPEDLAHISPYLTEHINRFGQVQHPPTRHPARGVRPETRRRLHPAARAGPDRRRSRPGA